MAISRDTLAEFRAHRENSGFSSSLYPYTMGRIEQVLNTPSLTPKQKVAICLENIAALDLVSGEA